MPIHPAPRIAVIACGVLEEELNSCAVHDNNKVVVTVQMEQGLHNTPQLLQEKVQATIDQLEADHDITAIVLGYGLCSRGTEGLTSKTCSLVIPRAHDCITILLGSKERYAQHIQERPGTYWYSVGWNRNHTPPGPDRIPNLRTELEKKFDDEEDIDYLLECEEHSMRMYSTASFIDTGGGGTKEESCYTKQCANCLGWEYEHLSGDLDLLQALLNGEWDDDRFLIIPPGRSFRMSGDDNVIELV